MISGVKLLKIPITKFVPSLGSKGRESFAIRMDTNCNCTLDASHVDFVLGWLDSRYFIKKR